MILDPATLAHALLGHDTLAERILWSLPRLPMSPGIAQSLAALLARPFIARRLDPAATAAALDALRAYATWFTPEQSVTDCLSASNNRTLELAVAAGSHVIVSLDDELLALHHWQGIRVLRPARAYHQR